MNKEETHKLVDAPKIAVIGAGYWGRNLIRNLFELRVLHRACDSSDLAVADVENRFPGVLTSTSLDEVLDDPLVDGVVVATPAATHYELAKSAIEAGKHVMIEKPFSTTTRHAEELVSLAADKGVLLMIGLTFLYNQAVRKVKALIDAGEVGDVYYIHSQRLNLGRVRQDTNAWWTLAPHDVSIVLYWLGEDPVEVNARGFSYLQDGTEDVVAATIKFRHGSVAFVQVSWLDPGKVRRMTIVGSKKMIVYDDVSPDMKVQVYDKGVDRKHLDAELGRYEDFGQFQLIHRAGDLWIPRIEFEEPLRTECAHFVRCIESGTEPFTSGKRSLNVVRVLEAAQESMRHDGILVRL